MTRFSLFVSTILVSLLWIAAPIAGMAGVRDVPLQELYADALEFVERKDFTPKNHPSWRWDPSAEMTRKDLIEILLQVRHEPWNTVPRRHALSEKPLEIAEAAKIISLAFGGRVKDHEIWFVPYLEFLAHRRALPMSLSRMHYPITRAEVAEIIYRLDNQISFKDSLDYLVDDEVVFTESLRPIAYTNDAFREKLSENSCLQIDYRMAMIFVGYQDPLHMSNINRFLTTLKERFEESFLFGTYGLITMDTSEKIWYMPEDGKTTLDGWTNTEHIAQQFYQEHADQYDFLTIVKNFDTKEAGDSHIVVSNQKAGTGQSAFNVNRYGNTQRLKGINIIDLPKGAADATTMRETLNLMLHETSHNWCCYFDEDFVGEGNGELAISKTGHFYPGLHHPYIGGGPLKSNHWYPVGDSWYEAASSQETLLKRLHPFSLYLMGVMPDGAFSMSFPVFSVGKDLNFIEKQGQYYDQYSVDDLIELQGEWSCESSS